MTIIPFDYSLLLTPISSSSSGSGTATPESAKARAAQAAFTTPNVTAPWNVQQSSVASSLLAKLADAETTTNFVDPVTNVAGTNVGDPDLQTSFTIFKALDRLDTLAKAAAGTDVSATDRQSLNKIFQTGLTQLQNYIANANGDKLRFAFSAPSSSATTITLPGDAPTISGTGIVTNRTDVIPGLTGTEMLTVNLSKGSNANSVNVDLSKISGPLTLDSVASAINAAIASVPLMQNGVPVLDASGNPVPEYMTRMTVQKTGDKWGFSWSTPETENVSLEQANAGDALVVSAAQNLASAPIASRVLKMTDVTNSLSYQNIATIAAVDANATSLAAAANPSTAPKVAGVAPPDNTVYATTSAAAVATTSDGYSYVVGTTQGNLGSNIDSGQPDLFLTKLDSQGKTVWQRQLGAGGQSEGLAVTVDSQGNAIVSGSTTAQLSPSVGFNSTQAFVAKYDGSGNQVFATQIDGVSSSQANALAVDSTGNIYMGGSVSGNLSGQTGLGSNDAIVVKLSTSGQILNKTEFGTAGSDSVSALAVHPDGSLIVATTENGQATIHQMDTTSLTDTAPSVSLGTGQVSSIAIDQTTGSIAVGGTTIAGLTSGTAVNNVSGYNDGFVAKLASNLSVGPVTYLGTSGTDSVDSLAYMNGVLYAGGRTNGVLGATRSGTVDGFVARIDNAGTIQNVRQFGGLTSTVDKVSIAADAGGDNVLGALGLQQGAITQSASDLLTSQTTLRAGDSFSIQVGTGPASKIVVQGNDTIDTLADRINLATGYQVNLTVSKLSTGTTLKFAAKAGLPIELTSGPSGSDALVKLGLSSSRIELPQVDKNAALITPGGSYGLNLSSSFAIDSSQNAGYVSTMLEKAIATVQSGYRSLYWDSTKQALIDGSATGSSSTDAYTTSRLANYQDALNRISALTGVSTTGTSSDPTAPTDPALAVLNAMETPTTTTSVIPGF